MSLYRTILLVDDDVEDQEIFMDAVSEVAPTVHCLCANDGDAALTLLTGNTLARPDILFIDLNMPRMNGKQVLQELKKRRDINNIPVIMYSTFFGEQDIEEITAEGAAHHMIKPTRFADLCSALSYILTTPW
ncbi:response regulator [Chryseolinea lacunae]|uniref:Response regulator n=1 Tax=Chryseolinea lacunae TaxID=2801331 RepID=A0ABS1L326_9BACT|nr:response regulator [Chryseolinea lacunae]MBL0745342.1 response regulator [Chryseolinea lacunae]